MSHQPKTYIAGTGMITAVGANTAMTAAAVKAGVSGYRASNYFTVNSRQPITMASVPDEVFTDMEVEIDEGDHYSAQYDRIIKMAILALREAVKGHSIKQPIPLILAVPEAFPNHGYIQSEALVKNLVNQKDLPLHAGMTRRIDSGRAAGIEALKLAQHLLNHQKAEYVLIGGSDSYRNTLRLSELEKHDRLLCPEGRDGFAPGEGACFLLLTSNPQRALTKNGGTVALGSPGIAEESGHLYSAEPYRGDGLDQAFKHALSDYTGPTITTVYSSMNGESHWAKEYGVAYIRNKSYFDDALKVEHPADCVGDLGAAAAPVLLALAADNLWQQKRPAAHLVYASADGAPRAAVCVEKVAAS